MEVYRVTKESPSWIFKAYDYARTDAFCFGQNIPIEFEYGHDSPVGDDYRAVVLIDEGKPVAGCNISFPAKDIGKIGRVCVIRDQQKNGVGTRLIEEAEKWILEKGAAKIVINSQDRALGFYEKLGYELVPGVDPRAYEGKLSVDPAALARDYKPQKNPLGFACVLVEKKVS